MARSSPQKKGGSFGFIQSLRPETIHGIIAIVLFALGAFFTLAGIDKAGRAGEYTYKGVFYLLGIGYFLVPTLAFLIATSLVSSLRDKFSAIKIFGAGIFFVASLGLVDLVSTQNGGIVGGLISYPLLTFLDIYVSSILLIALIVIGILIMFDISLSETVAFLRSLIPQRAKKEKEVRIVGAVADTEEPKKERASEPEEADEDPDTQPDEDEHAIEPSARTQEKDAPATETASAGLPVLSMELIDTPWTAPSLSMLERDSGKPGSGDVKANTNTIKRTLQNFGIDVEMDEVTIGPSVTRYAMKPAEGVKLSRIVALQDNLSLALAAHPLRIEAPIPGKSLVGIEIPNATKSMVGLGSILASEEYQSSDKSLLTALGKGISGKAHFGNLAKMPHLLIAGATGSGKSVTIHAIITSLLYRNAPEQLKFFMIDPKRVELTLYNGIPHLLTPVITDPKKTILALRWAANEMDRRYDLLEKHHVRDIDSYHKNVLAPAIERARKETKTSETETPAELPPGMPYIVIVIDELADIMATYPRELESAIVRLAQMSRAVGIHLILSTQRPSVNVITGLIKANVPARIALQVASQIDSRTILDMAGAEKLLGAGDMLYLAADMAKPVRIQSAFISEKEVKAVVAHIKKEGADRLPMQIELTAAAIPDKNALFEGSLEEGADGEDDDLYEEARQIVLQENKASTSLLQRRLSIGYGRAARIIDLLQERGVVGPSSGSKAREVLGAGVAEDTGAETPEERNDQGENPTT